MAMRAKSFHLESWLLEHFENIHTVEIVLSLPSIISPLVTHQCTSWISHCLWNMPSSLVVTMLLQQQASKAGLLEDKASKRNGLRIRAGWQRETLGFPSSLGTSFSEGLFQRSNQGVSLSTDITIFFFQDDTLVSFCILEKTMETPPPSSMKQGWNFSKGTFTRKLKGNQTEYKRTEAELQMGSGSSNL